MRGGLLAVGMALGVLAHTGLAEAQCTKDSDCKGQRVCEQGTCTEPAVQTEPSPPAPPVAVAPAPSAPAVERARLDEPEARHFFDEEKPRKVKKRISNPALMVAGIVLTAAGPTVWIVGALSYSCRSDDVSSSSSSCGPGVGGAWLFLGGAALIGAGIPLIVIGAKRVPAGRVAVAPWVSPRNAGLALRLDL